MRLSGNMVRLGAALCIALVAAEPLAIAQPVTGWGLPQLMESLSRVKTSSARFIERQTIHILNAPLLTSGTLRYVAPDWMQKTTTSPVPERFVLDGDRMTMAGGVDNQTHVFLLSDYPQIGGLVEGILATLGGDLPMLNRFYSVQLTGNQQAWQLLLQPRSAGLARFVAWIRIGGDGNRIDVIDTQSSNGDHSEMSVVEDVGNAG